MENPLIIPEAQMVSNPKIYAINIAADSNDDQELVVIDQSGYLQKTLICLVKIIVCIFLCSLTLSGIVCIIVGWFYKF
jgi:hypothetical protein